MGDVLTHQSEEDRPTYEAPRVMRMGDSRPGTGATCTIPGSGDGFCGTGSSANACTLTDYGAGDCSPGSVAVCLRLVKWCRIACQP